MTLKGVLKYTLQSIVVVVMVVAVTVVVAVMVDEEEILDAELGDVEANIPSLICHIVLDV